MNERAKQFTALAEEYFKCYLAWKQCEKDFYAAKSARDENAAELTILKSKLGEFVGQNVTTRAASLNGSMLTIDWGNNNTHTVKIYNSEGELLK